MSVVDGSNVDANNTNNAFMSRLQDTSTAGKVSLLNTDPASGPSITNLQASINSAEKNIQTLASVLNGAALSIDEAQGSHVFFLSGNAAAVTLSTTPFGASYAGLDGTTCVLIGLDDTNTVSLNFADIAKGTLLNGNATLTQGDCLTLIWSETLDRWIEQSRNF